MATKLATTAVETTAVSPTPAAARMQRSRKRHREGISCYTIQLRDNEIEALMDLGLLPSAERANRRSVIKAIHSFVDETLGKVRAAQPGSR